MSNNYVAVGWNRQKKVYDLLMALSVVLYLVTFVVLNGALHPTATAETTIIRAFGSAAIILLHIILIIGPLARLDRRFLPLLYNRRHLGVTMFLLGFIHGVFALLQYHAFTDMNPMLSLFLSNTNVTSVTEFPFQPLGFFALIILFLMAATSHDFWLTNLSAPVWKALHMMVYVAYLLLLGHVLLGSIQADKANTSSWLLGSGALLVIGLHLAAGFREGEPKTDDSDEWIEVCTLDEIPENRAKIALVAGERVAVFKYEGKVSAVSNVCQHQNGPLGEGKIVDGCITCPWHGYQYRPRDGASPPPFTEKIPTFNVRLAGDRVQVHRTPNPPGTEVEPAVIGGES